MTSVNAAALLGTRYLKAEDYANPYLQALRRELAELYRAEMGGVMHPMWAKRPDDVFIHWSRDWEYPWAFMNYLAWRIANPGRSHRLLDLGCGGSPLPIRLARRQDVALMLGLDWNDVMCPSAETSTLRRYGRRVTFPSTFTFCRADILKPLPLKSEGVDGVFSISVLEDYPDAWETVLSEIERVLRPGGFALVTVDVGRSGTNVDAVVAAVDRLFSSGPPGDLYFRCNLRAVVVRPVSTSELPGEYHVLGLSLIKGPLPREGVEQ